MKKPEQIPQEVIVAVQKYNSQHSNQQPVKTRELEWDSINGCYVFHRNNMFHGVEINGYVHT